MVKYSRNSSFLTKGLPQQGGSVSTDLHIKNHERRISQIESKALSDSTVISDKLASLSRKSSELSGQLEVVESKLILQSEINEILKLIESVRSESSLNSAAIHQNSLILSRIPSIEGTLKAMSSDIASLDDMDVLVGTLQSSLSGLETRILLLEASEEDTPEDSPSVSDILVRVEALEAALEELKADTTVADLSEKVVALEESTNLQNTINEDFETRVAVLEASPGYDDTNVLGLISKNSSDISDLDVRVTAIEVLGGGGSGGDVDLTPVLERLTEVETTTDHHGESIGGLVTGLSNVELTTADHASRIEVLEATGGTGGGDVDLSPVIARIAALEDSDTTQDASIGTINTNIDSLENRVNVLETDPGITLPDTVVQTDKACTMTEGLTLQSKPLVIKDKNYPRLELWMDAEHGDTQVRHSSVELNRGKITIQGKNDAFQVSTSVVVPAVGSHTTPANVITDQCDSFTGLETRVSTLEAGESEAVLGLFHSNEDNTVNMVEDGSKLRINFKASNFLANNLRAGAGITLTPGPTGSNYITVGADSDLDPTPTKWYVLPLAGQSNMMGTGERDMPLENIPRLKQLASLDSPEVATESQTNVTLISSNYGARFREFRPVVDTNLTLIPATPCLDGAQNKFFEMHTKGKEGGQVSVGLYIAKAILPYIPSDYGIIIVDGSTGSSGFGDQFREGTYNSTTKRANLGSNKAAKWAANTPLDKQFRERVKHCLDLNPENKLLPVIWCQGENDVEVQQHYERSKEYFKHLRTFFSGYEDRLPKGLAENFRIICYGTTRKMFTQEDDDPTTMGRSIHDFDIDYRALPGAGSDPWGIHNFINSRSNFDNYAYHMEDPEFLGGAQKRPQVIFVRVDIDRFGKFTESADEEGVDQGGALIGYSADWHFSTNTITNHIPSQLLNAIGGYTDYLYSPFVTSGPWARHVRGKFGLVHTDNVRYVFDNSINDDVSSVYSGLSVAHDLPVTPSVEDGTLAAGLTVESSYTTVNDPVMGAVGSFGEGSFIKYGVSDVLESSFTACVSFKDTSGDAENTSLLCAATGSVNALRIEHIDGSWMFYPEYKHGDADSTSKNFMLHKHLHGGWKGGRGDWQHLAIVYCRELKVMHFYVNGCLVESLKNVNTSTPDFYVGKDPHDSSRHFKGLISRIRLYRKALSRETINTLIYQEMGN